MNFKSLYKPVSIAILFIGMGQTALAMENEANSNPLNEDFYNKSLLLGAVALNNVKFAQDALNNHAKPNCLDGYGRSPLYTASYNGYKEFVKLLLEFDADINYINEFGNTSLHIASERGHQEIANLLLANSADINCINKYGNTPLHLASRSGHQGIAKLLLDFGADINCKDDMGRTAEFLARICHYDEISKLITDEIEKRKAKQKEEFNNLSNKRLLEKWNEMNPKNNIDALIQFVGNRDRQQKTLPKVNQ
jgi:ankyrin repeat protein